MAAETPTSDSSAAGGLGSTARARLSGMGKVFAGFREFIARGNVVELAVGIAIGAAFGAVVAGLTDGLIGPLVALVLQGQDLSNSLSWYWGDTAFSVGVVLDALLKFLITAAAIYFAVVLPLNAWNKRRAAGKEPEPVVPAEDVALLREIRDLLAVPTTARAATVATVATDESAPDEDTVPPATPPPSFPPGS